MFLAREKHRRPSTTNEKQWDHAHKTNHNHKWQAGATTGPHKHRHTVIRHAAWQHEDVSGQGEGKQATGETRLQVECLECWLALVEQQNGLEVPHDGRGVQVHQKLLHRLH